MTNKETLDSLDEAGRLLAPILQAEEQDGRRISVFVRNGAFIVDSQLGNHFDYVCGDGDTLSAAFVQFLANRSDKLAQLDREAQDRAEFARWQAEQRSAAA